jgi:DNA-binding LytR/AlgR family response regulator
LGEDVVYLMSELHYLRVVTTRGSALILYTLRDAILELSHTDGLQPHRSYWVASAHVRGLHRRGNAWRLELDCGELVPVSRRKQSEIRSRWPVLGQ